MPHSQRHFLCPAQWLPVAHAAASLRPVDHGVRLISLLAARRGLEATADDAARTGASASGESADAQRRHPGGQDDRAGRTPGSDGAKKRSGRKRHLLVDTLGVALGALVHPADIQDRFSARGGCAACSRPCPVWSCSGRIATIWDRYRPRSRRRSAGGCRSSSGPAVGGGLGCAPTRSRPHGCRASSPRRTAGLLNGRLHGSAAPGG